MSIVDTLNNNDIFKYRVLEILEDEVVVPIVEDEPPFWEIFELESEGVKYQEKLITKSFSPLHI